MNLFFFSFFKKKKLFLCFFFYIFVFLNLCKHDGDEEGLARLPQTRLWLWAMNVKCTLGMGFLSPPHPPLSVGPKKRLSRKNKTKQKKKMCFPAFDWNRISERLENSRRGAASWATAAWLRQGPRSAQGRHVLSFSVSCTRKDPT